MNSTELATHIRNRIHIVGSMTLDEIVERGVSKGHDKRLVLEALMFVHKYRDITAKTTAHDVVMTNDEGEEVTVQEHTVTYTVTQIKQAKPELIRWRPSPEQQAVMDKELEDFIDKCPFLSDRERELYRIPSKDWTDDDHELMDTPLEYNLYMERKHGAPQWKRMKGDRIYSTL